MTNLKRPAFPFNCLPQLVKVHLLLSQGTHTPEQMARIADMGINRVRSSISWLKALGAPVDGTRGLPWKYSEPWDLRLLVDQEVEALFAWQPPDSNH